eukprot:9987976-Ditylum_brightwellii.AAC.1
MLKHKSIAIEQKLLIPLAFWTDSIDSEWWRGASYHPSMTNITVDMALHNDARQFLANNKEFVATIKKYSSPMSDSASSDCSISFAADEDANYCSDDIIEDNVDVNDLESESSDNEEQEDEVEDKEMLAPAEKKGNK